MPLAVKTHPYKISCCFVYVKSQLQLRWFHTCKINLKNQNKSECSHCYSQPQGIASWTGIKLRNHSLGTERIGFQVLRRGFPWTWECSQAKGRLNLQVWRKNCSNNILQISPSIYHPNWRKQMVQQKWRLMVTATVFWKGAFREVTRDVLSPLCILPACRQPVAY